VSRVATLAARFRTAAWLGWQIEANWADPFTFIVYSVVRPLAVALILAVMYRAVAGVASAGEAFLGFYVANAFHEYVTRVLVGMGWTVVEEREEYETLKYVYTSPVGIFTYLWGRSTVKFAQATLSLVLILAMGWLVMGLRWDWGGVRWAPFLMSVALGLTATIYFGFLVAGWALVLPRAAISVNEGVAAALYLLCGVIFPIDLLPKALQAVALVLPFTWWYEGLRRFMLGHGASARLAGLSDASLLGALAATTIVFAVVSTWAYHALERRARRQGKLDQATLF
jgi:ABC-2 type transport system permease protein